MNHLLDFAQLKSIATAYLWTPGSTELYDECGWKIFGTASYADRAITLMQIAL